MRYVKYLTFRCLLSGVLACAAFCAVNGQTADKGSRPNFTGVWVLNLSQSNGYGMDLSEFGKAKTEIVHNDPEFRILNRGVDAAGAAIAFAYFSDDRGESNALSSGVQRSQTKWDGKKLVTKANGGGFDEVKTEWEMSPDGNRLTQKKKFVARTTMMWNGKVDKVTESSSKLLLVFDRQTRSAPDQTPPASLPQDIPALIELLDDKSMSVAIQAGRAERGPGVIPALLDNLNRRKSCQFQYAASGIIFRLQPDHPGVNPILFAIVKGNCQGTSENDLKLRRAAAIALGAKLEGIPVMTELLKDNDTFTRRSAIFAFDELTERIEDGRPDKIDATPELLAAVKKAIPALVDAMSDTDEIVYCMAYESLGQLRRSMHQDISLEVTSRMRGVKVKCIR